MKGGGIKKETGLRRPVLLGALLDILPTCIDITETGEEVKKGYYSKQLTKENGEGAYNHDGKGIRDSSSPHASGHTQQLVEKHGNTFD
jgi:hypothetical protein